jgi:hypothetical protein
MTDLLHAAHSREWDCGITGLLQPLYSWSIVTPSLPVHRSCLAGQRCCCHHFAGSVILPEGGWDNNNKDNDLVGDERRRRSRRAESASPSIPCTNCHHLSQTLAAWWHCPGPLIIVDPVIVLAAICHIASPFALPQRRLMLTLMPRSLPLPSLVLMMAVVLLCLLVSRALWLLSTAMEAKEDVAQGINIHCCPPSFSPTPILQADCQFIFYGEQHALLPPLPLHAPLGLPTPEATMVKLQLPSSSSPSSSFPLFLSLHSQSHMHTPL